MYVLDILNVDTFRNKFDRIQESFTYNKIRMTCFFGTKGYFTAKKQREVGVS